MKNQLVEYFKKFTAFSTDEENALLKSTEATTCTFEKGIFLRK